MRVPMSWLQQYVAVEATTEELARRLTMGGLEVEGIEDSSLGPVLDVYITPNRGDCLSMVGVAREVAALYDLPLLPPAPPVSSPNGPVLEQTSVTLLEPQLCPRYAARIVRGIKIGPSPAWLQARLEAAGQRPINNVVDVTNYVMLELGQPLHAFDLHKLAEERIVVRRATDGETIKTLDGEERILNSNVLVIADATKPVAVAGVMGGADSEVDENSVDILLESAHFDPLSVRRTSRTLKLRTEASYRFERVVDPNGVQRAIDRACQLLEEMGQPAAVPGILDVYPETREPRQQTLRVSRAAMLLGMDITPQIATECLQRLEFTVAEPTVPDVLDVLDVLNVAVPTFRPDITLEEDLVEEVGRIYGYENIPETLPYGETTQGGDSPDGRLIDRIKRTLLSLGMQEVVTHSLAAPGFFDSPEDLARRVPVRNALSAEVSGLRQSLLTTLLDVAKHNASFQQTSLAIFEVGRIWHLEHGVAATGDGDGEADVKSEGTNSGEAVETLAVAGLLVGAHDVPGWYNHNKVTTSDFYTMRGIVEGMFARLGIDTMRLQAVEKGHNTGLHPGRTALIQWNGETVGVIGEIHPRVANDLPFRDRIYVFEIAFDALRATIAPGGKPPRFVSLPRFPAIIRDLAPRFPVTLPYGRIEAALGKVQAEELPLLASFRVADLFEGSPLPEGQRSLTLSFTFRATDRTLTDSEVNQMLIRISDLLESECGAIFLPGSRPV